MKTTIKLASLTLLLLLGLYAVTPAQVLNALTAATLQARAWTFSALQTFGAGVTVSAGDLTVTSGALLRPATKVVEICPSGCEYTSLNAACAGETSTTADPIVYHVRAGTYTSASTQTCSGEANATIRGDGPTTSRIINTATGAGDYGGIDMGTSTDWTIEDLYVKAHRAIIVLGASTGGGDVMIRNAALESPGVDLDEDCGWFNDFAAGTRLRVYENLCMATQDSFTIDNDAAQSLRVYSKGNHFRTRTGSTHGNYGGWVLEGIPCEFVAQGDTFQLTGAVAGGTGATSNAYRFDGAAVGCTSGTATIIGPSVNLANTDSNGETGLARGVEVLSTATELVSLHVIDARVVATTTDATTGEAKGVQVQNATTDVYVVGGHYRTSGGLSNRDFHGGVTGSRITLIGVDYETENNFEGAGINVLAGDMRRLKATTEADFSGGVIRYDSNLDNTNAIVLDNTDETTAGTRESPILYFCDGTAAANEDCFMFKVNTSGRMVIRSNTGKSGAGTSVWEVNVSGGVVNNFLDFAVAKTGGTLMIGSGVNSDANNLFFNSGTTDQTLRWNDTNDRMEWVTAATHRYTPLATAPATCSIGDFYADSSGGVCHCTATNTWTNVTPGPIGDCT